MAVYVIGDVQGCLDALRRLLECLRFDPTQDRLWFCGDLVNRGPDSADTLRLLRAIDPAVVSVLGNHDLHLLACAADPNRIKRRDTVASVLEAPDAAELIDWLRGRSMLHHDPELGYTLIHAGLPPEWDLGLARRCAAELESVLRGTDLVDYLDVMYGNQPDRWRHDLEGHDRLRYITNCLTRLRYVHVDGRLALKPKGAPGTQPAGTLPWFDHPQRASRGERILFGHWSTLGYHAGSGVWCLDSGCLWGGRLSALRIDGEAPELIQVDCPQAMQPNRFARA